MKQVNKRTLVWTYRLLESHILLAETFAAIRGSEPTSHQMLKDGANVDEGVAIIWWHILHEQETHRRRQHNKLGIFGK